MLQPYALTTKEAVKSYLDLTDSTWDVVLEDLVNSCTDWIEAECGGRRLRAPVALPPAPDPVDSVEYYHGGVSLLSLRSFPIVSVSEVAYKSGPLNAPVWVPLTVGTYGIDAERGQLIVPSALPVGHRNIRVSYQAGYGTVPSDLSLGCIKLVAREFNRRKSQGTTAESVAGANVTWATDVDLDTKTLIKRYRNYAF